MALEAGNRAGEEVASSEAHRTLCQSGSRSEGPTKSLLDASLLHAILMMPHISMTMVVIVCDDYEGLYFLPFITCVHVCAIHLKHIVSPSLPNT